MASRGWDNKVAEDLARRRAVASGVPSGLARQAVSKYRAVKTVVDGITFHSKREAQRYHELKLLERAWQIQDLILQPVFVLHVNGEKVGKCVLDFSYATGVLGERIFEDVKGMDNALSKWKRRHCELEHGIAIRIIR